MTVERYYNKINALKQVSDSLSELKIGSSYYKDAEAFNNFKKAYYHLLKNTQKYLEEDCTERAAVEFNQKFEKELKLTEEEQ